MAQHIQLSDIHIMDAEPRVQDLKLAEALEFAQPRMIRKLIQRNTDELASHGEVCATVSQTSEQGGRPGTEYWLNEPQALLVSMFARTPKAEIVRKEIIQVFVAYRNGKLRMAQEAVAAPETVRATVAQTPDEPIAVLSMKLGLVRETRQLFGVAAAQRMWRSQGLPAVDLPVPVSLAAVDRDAAACLAHLLAYRLRGTRLSARFGEEEEYDQSIGEMIEAAIENDADCGLNLAFYGIRIEDGEEASRFWVANHCEGLRRVFRDTPWVETWRYVLKRLPDARPTKVWRIDERTTRGVSLPEDYLERATVPA